MNPQPASYTPRAGQNPASIGPVTRYSIDFMIRWTDVEFDADPAMSGHGQTLPHGKLQIGLIAYARDGHAVNWTGGTQEMRLQPDVYASIQKSGIPAHAEIDLPTTEINLMTGIYDWATGKLGTLEIPLHPAAGSASVESPGKIN
jgi:hypothetical protein